MGTVEKFGLKSGKRRDMYGENQGKVEKSAPQKRENQEGFCFCLFFHLAPVDS